MNVRGCPTATAPHPSIVPGEDARRREQQALSIHCRLQCGKCMEQMQ
jgi:hypothetical protein